jgi:glutathione S-transferase
MRVLDAQLAKGKWLLGDDFTLVERAYGPMLNVVEEAGFGYSDSQGARILRRDPFTPGLELRLAKLYQANRTYQHQGIAGHHAGHGPH